MHLHIPAGTHRFPLRPDSLVCPWTEVWPCISRAQSGVVDEAWAILPDGQRVLDGQHPDLGIFVAVSLSIRPALSCPKARGFDDALPTKDHSRPISATRNQPVIQVKR